MSNLRQAAQQALEAMEIDCVQRTYAGGVRIANAAIVLRAALAEPEQPYDQTALDLCKVCGWRTLIPGDACLNCERAKQPEQSPVAWVEPKWLDPDTRGWPSDSFEALPIEGWLPLYTAPTPSNWVGLTDEEIDVGLCRSPYALQTAQAWRDGVEWAQEQLREKNT